MSAHTNENWYVGGNGRDILVFDRALDRGQLIATVASYIYSEGHTPQGPETARLIAAAPDLLNVLTEIVEYAGGAENALHDEYVMDRVLAAIAKATGAA